MATYTNDFDFNDPLVEYPKNIRGSLRITLQIKDLFILAFNMVESYRTALLACQRGFTRNLAIYNLSVGLNSINQLRSEIEEIRKKVEAKANRNRALRHHIKTQCRQGVAIDARLCNLVNRMKMHITKLESKNGRIVGCVDKDLSGRERVSTVEAALHGGLEVECPGDIDVDKLDVPEEVDLTKDASNACLPLLPVVDFYRGYFFLQMHFQLAMCLTANHSMPLITQPLSLGRRLRGWPTNLGKITKKRSNNSSNEKKRNTNGGIGDRLEDIHDELVCLLGRLRHCMRRVDEKSMQDKVIERYYREQCAAQERVRRGLLRCLQDHRQMLERLDEQNDHLTGMLVKSDPGFTRLEKFHDFTGEEGIYELIDESVTRSETSPTHSKGRGDDTEANEEAEEEEGDSESEEEELLTASAKRESATQTMRQMKDPQVDRLLVGVQPTPSSSPRVSQISITLENIQKSPEQQLQIQEPTHTPTSVPPEVDEPPPASTDHNQSSSVQDLRRAKRISILRGMTTEDGENYLDLPDSNDNHRMHFNEKKRAEDEFSTSSWQEISDMSSCKPVSISNESVDCLLPGWAKNMLKNATHDESESETEEEIRNDDRRSLSSAKLEKRQILVEAILKADVNRLEQILSTLLKPTKSLPDTRLSNL